MIPLIKDILFILVYAGTAITALITIHKWIVPRIKQYFGINIYIRETGVHILKDIEASFGKEAGQVIKDILQRKTLQNSINEMRLNIIENAVGLGIFLTDVTGKCTYANKTLAKIFGMSQEEMLGFGWITPIVDKQKAYNNWKFAIDNDTPYRDHYVILVNEQEFTVLAEAEASYDENEKEILGYVGIVKIVK